MEILTIVTDKDGTLYSAEKYVTPLALHLSKRFGQERFMEDYCDFRERAVIGRRYNIETLQPDENGSLLPHAFCTSSFVAEKHGMKYLEIGGEFKTFYPQIFNDPNFPYEPVLEDIFASGKYGTILVTNNERLDSLKTMGLENTFDIMFKGANKYENLDEICYDMQKEHIFVDPKRTLWLEDDISILKRIKAKDYQTALRKTKGFNYIPDEELLEFCDLILDDELSTLHWYLKQNAQQQETKGHLT